MANSNFEYVKKFERDEILLNNCWIVVRIDGHAFHKFTTLHDFAKPNDDRGLKLMNLAAKKCLETFNDIVYAFGHSDEYSFVFRRKTALYGRRRSKIESNVVSLFSSSYCFHWKDCFEDVELKSIPSFDARTVCYPTNENMKDYLKWRQVDCHINNLYNTVFWALVLRGNLTNQEATEKLRPTFSKDKHEILFSQFNINYNNEAEIYKKGSFYYRKRIELKIEDSTKNSNNNSDNNTNNNTKRKSKKKNFKSELHLIHEDIIKGDFWDENLIENEV